MVVLVAVTACILVSDMYFVASGLPTPDRAQVGVLSQSGDDSGPSSASTPWRPETRLFPEILSVTDAAMHDGMWWILDRWGHQIHRVTPEGVLQQTFGREGEGPGEFRNPRRIVIHEDTVVVVGDRTLHLFDSGGQHIADRRIGPFSWCPGARMEAGVSSSSGLLLLLDCLDPRREDGGGRHVLLETGDAASRSVAYKPRYRTGRVAGLASFAVVLSDHPRGFLFGSVQDECLGLFDPLGATLGTVCHDWIERVPLSISREDRENVRHLARRYSSFGIRLEVPTHRPPFERITTMDGDRLVYYGRVPVDRASPHGAIAGVSTEVWRAVVPGDDGQPIRLQVPEAPILFLDGESVLAAWDEPDGTRIVFHTLSGK